MQAYQLVTAGQVTMQELLACYDYEMFFKLWSFYRMQQDIEAIRMKEAQDARR